jgi:hypothetical protein
MAIDPRKYLAPHRPMRMFGLDRALGDGAEVVSAGKQKPAPRGAGSVRRASPTSRARSGQSGTVARARAGRPEPEAPSSPTKSLVEGRADLRHRRRAEIDQLLEGKQRQVMTGATDRNIAALFDIRPDDVRAWRRRKGLAGKRGRPRLELPVGVHPGERVPRSRLQRTLGGPEDPLLPAYVEKRPLDYLLLGKLTAAAVELGWTVEDLALATGVHDTDLGVAYDIYQARQAVEA